MSKAQESNGESVSNSSEENPNTDLKTMDRAALKLSMNGKYHSVKVTLAESGGIVKRKKASPEKSSTEQDQS